MTREFQIVAVMGTVYATAARLIQEDRVTLFDQDLAWPRSELVDHDVEDEEVFEEIHLALAQAVYAPALQPAAAAKPGSPEGPGGHPDKPPPSVEG